MYRLRPSDIPSYEKALPALERAARSSRGGSLVKLADGPQGGPQGGGPPQGGDTSFEQAFSNLAHAVIKEKAPSLLDFEIGFQTIDKNDDNTKAVGIFGFKVGDQWLYAPVFFLNGQIKGQDMLYLKGQDLFVPLREGWINYLLGRRPGILGGEVSRNLSRIGVSSPSLWQLSRSPFKYASATPGDGFDWLTDARRLIARLATSTPSFPPLVPDFLKTAGSDGALALAGIYQARPDLARAADSFYGPGVLDLAAREGIARERLTRGQVKAARKPDILTPEVKIVRLSDPDAPEDLDDDEKELLLRDKILVKDRRPKERTTSVFRVSPEFTLSSPGETGLYDVLLSPYSIKKCLVLFGPTTQDGTQRYCTVVELSSRRWVNIHPSKVMVTQQHPREDWEKWFTKLPKAKVSGGTSGLRMILTRSGSGTVPFRVIRSYDSGRSKSLGGSIHDVHFSDHVYDVGPYHLEAVPQHRPRAFRPSASPWERIRLTGREGLSFAVRDGEVVVPGDARMLDLEKPVKAKGAPDGGDPDCGCSDPGPLVPGSTLDLRLFIESNTTPLGVKSAGSGLVSVDGRPAEPLGEAAARLVARYGLTVKTACQVVAESVRCKQASYRLIKNSLQTYELQKTGPGAPTPPEPPTSFDPLAGGAPATPSFSALVRSGDTSQRGNAVRDDPRTPPKPDPSAMRVMADAAQSGQREVFDTAMFNGLLKSVSDDNVIDRYLPALTKGMDACGRLLTGFYWHKGTFAERYGKQDLDDIEDALRNTFQGTGELVLDLKRKSPGPVSERDYLQDELGDLSD